MSAEGGRKWALETFGPDGAKVRAKLPTVMKALHTRMADAQDASGMRARGVYGNIWRGALETLVDEFGKLQGAFLFTPKGANYKVVCLNGTLLFPWRFSTDDPAAISNANLITSPARLALFTQARPVQEEELDLDFERPELTDADREILTSYGSHIARAKSEARSVVLIAYSSSSTGLHSLEWGDVKSVDGDTGHVEWDFHESLLAPTVQAAVQTPPTKRADFATGVIPQAIVVPRLVANDDE
ncbi:hypothetical protein [Aeromicrobium wangtongii]|uniref:Uncharacterized protein n=1 Tax=Aeromicrobium wangtongii TaxID=2969247 RepID=A0ABY5MAW9_9ACTN|nr:hypothetical protein [Aeromicrobium wangtongii]MCD9197470.1 hypothetical protein [Aeromicrobium wangtongii]UUP14962.1 hypothetical protein NQV15_06535 [Aeromicrobium wangtongii]